MYTIPHGVEIGPDGNVWTTDANTSKIYEFSPMGKKLLEIDVGAKGDGPGQFNNAHGIAVGPDGNIRPPEARPWSSTGRGSSP